MVEGPVANRRFKRRTIRNAIIAGVAVIIVFVVGGGGWYLYSKISTASEQAELEAKNKMAQSVANHFQDKLAKINDQLIALAKDEQTKSLFETGDDAALQKAANENQDSFNQALKLRYIKPGSYQLDNSSVPPLSYASLDMLKKAETRSQIDTEVHLFGTPNEHIVMLERVVNDDHNLIGLIHLSLNIALTGELISDLELSQGYVELRQQVAGQDLVLEKKGDAAQQVGEPVTTALKNTRWEVAYWSSSAPVDTSTSGFPILPVIILLILVGAGGAFFIIKRRGGSSSSDEDSHLTYEGAVRAIAEGAHAGVEQLIPNLPKGERITANLKPVSKGMAGDDVTMIAKPTEKKAEPKPKAKPEKNENDDTPPSGTEIPKPAKKAEIASVIFRTYDIRGVVGETLTESAVEEIGRALGTMANERGQQCFVVGRDGRASSQGLSDALISGLRSTGRDVIDIGLVPTPVLYFATHHLETGSGVMVTGSHNPAEYNGLKMVLGGNTLSGEEIKEIQSRTQAGEYATGQGDLRHSDIAADYIRRISEDIPVALGSSLKIVIDCGNGAAGVLAPQLLSAIGHDIVELYCDIDGNFPNHHPDPSQPENLQDLIEKVKAENADIGFAFDGDGDRLGVVDAEGNIIWPDRQMMLLAKDVLSRNQGAPIIFDVKCSRYLKSIIESNGGKPLMWKTGHSLIKNKMKEVEAPLAGEMSGHIFFKERWYGFDDALYTAARFVEIFTNSKTKPTELFAELPEGFSTPELRLPLPENEHGQFMAVLIEKMSDSDAEIIDIDGVRIEYKDGWGLARPSNTSPNIILRFEGESEEAVERIKGEFRNAIQDIKPDAQLPF